MQTPPGTRGGDSGSLEQSGTFPTPPSRAQLTAGRAGLQSPPGNFQAVLLLKPRPGPGAGPAPGGPAQMSRPSFPREQACSDPTPQLAPGSGEDPEPPPASVSV